jgi:large subunit ribosomal protein L10
MSKPIKQMIVREYQKRFEGVEGGVLVEIRGMDAGTNNRMRTELVGKKIRVSVVKNTLAGKAFQGTALESLSKFLSGPSALMYGGESVVALAREIVAWAKDKDSLKFKAAILDGITFEGKAGVEALSKYPTREEAQAKVITLVLSPARNVVGAAKGPAGRIGGIIKEIQRKLEAGETIAAKA